MNSLKIVKMLFVVFLLSTLTACKTPIVSRAEIKNNTFIRVVGIDVASNKNDSVKLTIVSEKISPNSQIDSNDKKANIVSAEGRTIFEANRNLHALTNNIIYWGHTETILISKEAAMDNIVKYLDFFIRDHELRLTSKVLIVEGSTVEEFLRISNSPQYFIGDKINNLVSDSGALSLSKEVKLYELIDVFESEYSSAYIPIIYLTNKNDIGITNDTNNIDMKLEGYAIFKENKMIDSLHNNNARGLNWATNNIDSGVILVKDNSNNDVALEIISSNTKIKPKYDENDLSVVIEIYITSNIVEQEEEENIYTEEAIERIKRQQEDIIIQEVQDIIKYVQENNIDTIGVGNAVYHKYPVIWKKEIEDKWSSLFPQISIKVKVNSNINRVYNIKQPIGADE